jgi:hypothetical protein
MKEAAGQSEYLHLKTYPFGGVIGDFCSFYLPFSRRKIIGFESNLLQE